MPARLAAVAQDPRVRGALLLFALLAVIYSFSVGLRATRGASITADEPFYLLTTQSLLQDGNLDLTGQYGTESYRSFFDHAQPLWRQSVPNEDGLLLSPHEPGLSMFLVPGFAIAGLVGAQVQMLVLTAATFALAFVLVASETRQLLISWLATAAVAVTATAFVYSTEIYPEVPAAMLLVLALLVVRCAALNLSHAVLLAALLTVLAWFGMKYVPLGVLLALYFLWRATSGARLTFLLLSAGSAAAYVGLHVAIYGSLTAYNINTVFEGAPTTEVLDAHFQLEDRPYRIYGLFIDQRFGIGRWAPILLPILPALVLLTRRGSFHLLALSLVLTQLLIATFVAITMMGWWFPGRTLVAVFPLFALVLAHLIGRLPAIGRAGLGLLTACSVLFLVLLVIEVRAGAVTLAVDPFTMPAALFKRTAGLFPDYRGWGVATVLRTVAWVSAMLSAGAFLLWLELRPRARPLAPDPQPERSIPPSMLILSPPTENPTRGATP